MQNNISDFLTNFRDGKKLSPMAYQAISTAPGKLAEITDCDTQTAVKRPTNAELALYYASIGWYVFPCLEADGLQCDKSGNPKTAKNPYNGYKYGDLYKGVSDATNDADTIRKWWQRWPGALVGINCGKSGLFVIDLDRHEGDPDGVANFLRLARGRAITCGCFQVTLSEGLHLVYKAPVVLPGYELPGCLFDAEIRKEFVDSNPNLPAEKLKKNTIGIDFRRGEQYICTGTAADGRRYEWITGTPQAGDPGELCEVVNDWLAGEYAKQAEAAREAQEYSAFLASNPDLKAAADDCISLIKNFEAGTSWDYILTGWRRNKSNLEHWLRPGTSKTTGRHGITSTHVSKLTGATRDFFYNDSESANIPSGWYSKWTAYVCIHFSGNHKAAMADLWAMYYRSNIGAVETLVNSLPAPLANQPEICMNIARVLFGYGAAGLPVWKAFCAKGKAFTELQCDNAWKRITKSMKVGYIQLLKEGKVK